MLPVVLAIIGCSLAICGSVEATIAQAINERDGASGILKYRFGLVVMIVAAFVSILS